ncbi:MAG: fluoride efflux transporter CrcB [Paracoccus denitrificans]|uniref:Fluoride-specific ion channel FluC n=1 Tax=Paracoccus denitrificans TaxID=266 RepID=A0A533I6N1_PARDE|nr:MAG: fluoride efflux transporter CrcB [Paracoccus denitrificans]
MTATFLLVAAGGAIGASARHAVNLTALRLFGPGFPVATLTVNVIGSLLMGLLVAWLGLRGTTYQAAFLMTGLLGGFTTFSAFSVDALVLIDRGQTGLALAYILGSVSLSLLAAFAGMAIGRGILA